MFDGKISFTTIIFAALALLTVLFAAGWLTRENPGEKPYLLIAGKGFIFNYRVADAFYGFTAYLTKPVPNYSVIEAVFEDPAGGEPHTVRVKVTPRSKRYGLRTPSLKGITKHTPYSVHVRLLRWGDDAVLFDETFTVSSQISSDEMPDKPLTIGPGYHPNPELNKDGS